MAAVLTVCARLTKESVVKSERRREHKDRRGSFTSQSCRDSALSVITVEVRPPRRRERPRLQKSVFPVPAMLVGNADSSCRHFCTWCPADPKWPKPLSQIHKAKIFVADGSHLAKGRQKLIPHSIRHRHLIRKFLLQSIGFDKSIGWTRYLRVRSRREQKKELLDVGKGYCRTVVTHRRPPSEEEHRPEFCHEWGAGAGDAA